MPGTSELEFRTF
ncbi:hypothetical protein BsWGS_16903 [Bradybaena similaris]